MKNKQRKAMTPQERGALRQLRSVGGGAFTGKNGAQRRRIQISFIRKAGFKPRSDQYRIR